MADDTFYKSSDEVRAMLQQVLEALDTRLDHLAGAYVAQAIAALD